MAILSPLERRTIGGKVLVGTIYAILIAGAATTIYPFLLMVSGSMKSEVDIAVMDPLPSYLVSDKVLYEDHVHSVVVQSGQVYCCRKIPPYVVEASDRKLHRFGR